MLAATSHPVLVLIAALSIAAAIGIPSTRTSARLVEARAVGHVVDSDVRDRIVGVRCSGRTTLSTRRSEADDRVMTKLVVTGFDGSDSSRRAVLWAADEASIRQCALKIVACFTPPLSGDFALSRSGTEAFSMVEQLTEHELKEMGDEVAARFPGLDLVTGCEPGFPAATLVDGTTEDDLIVVGASRHRDAAAFWLGSTARAVVRTAPCPVAVIRGEWPTSRPARVVVAIDGSEPSMHALRWAVAHAERHQVPLRLVHAWDYPYVKPALVAALATADPGHVPGRALKQVQACEVMEIDAAQVLEAAARLAGDWTTMPIDSRLVRGGPVHGVLASVAEDELLVVGSRGRGALMAGLFGSVANAVLDGAAGPVVVVTDGTK